MRNLLAFAAVLVIVFLTLGWYLDWYSIQSTPSGPGRQSYNIDFDKRKIADDVKRGIERGEEKIHDVFESSERQKP